MELLFGAAAAGGGGLFSYNRENYMFDKAWTWPQKGSLRLVPCTGAAYQERLPSPEDASGAVQAIPPLFNVENGHSRSLLVRSSCTEPMTVMQGYWDGRRLQQAE